MAKRRKVKRRRKSKRFPLSAGIGIATSVLAPPISGWGSVLSKVQEHKLDEAGQSFIAAWTGLKLGGIGGQSKTEIDLFGAINPFDMQTAPAWKATFWSSIVLRLARKFGGDVFAKIPYVGKYLGMS